jgi:hypothetical protein
MFETEAPVPTRPILACRLRVGMQIREDCWNSHDTRRPGGTCRHTHTLDVEDVVTNWQRTGDDTLLLVRREDGEAYSCKQSNGHMVLIVDDRPQEAMKG